MTSRLEEDLERLLQARFNVLKSLPLIQLQALPEMLEEEIEIQGKHIDVITWRDNLPNGLIFVIFQFWFKRFLCNRCMTEGFILQPNGEIREATDEEWTEYGGL